MSPILHTVLKRAAAAIALAAPLAAAAAAGQFTFVTGEVTLLKSGGQRLAPAKGTAVDPGDRVVTGANGMVQLTMVDQARLSLRPNSQFLVERYPERPEASEGVVLTLLRGTLRTFTGLLSSVNRDKFVMKTNVATVGIRGSGNILYACDGADCDPSVAGEGGSREPITVNHTIEGSHAVTNLASGAVPGMPAQQGGAQTVITGPGQTVLVQGLQPPRYIPTPAFIREAATNMTNAKPAAASGETLAAGPVRSFAPGDSSVVPAAQTSPAPLVGNNGLGFPLIDASTNLATDPLALHDVVMAAVGSPISGQALGADLDFSGNDFHGYRAYDASGLSPAVTGGTLHDSGSVSLANGPILFGRWSDAALGYSGPGSTSAVPGSVHWIVGPSGYPMYLADVLTGVATYTLAGATSPTNQNGTAGALGSATLQADFTHRTIDVALVVTVPGNAGGNWSLDASGVPLALNRFYASTGNHLVIVNAGGVSSASNGNLTGSIDGSFVGAGLSGAILGYGISDLTSGDDSHWSIVNGVAAFTGPAQSGLAPYREGRVSDPEGHLVDFVRSYATTDRPDEVTTDAQGRVTGFTAPFPQFGSHATYALGSAQVVQSGADPQTGLVWGRWSGGVAQVSTPSQSHDMNLANASLHYVFAASQSGPVALPLTGTASYDVLGATSPTDAAGHVGTFGSATLAANFTNRTVDASVNIAINGQAWSGAANGMPIYRDQYFSAFSGTPIAGATNPAPLVLGCTPACGANARGSFDGFFTGTSGQGAGLLYNLGGNQGAVAFGRRGGG